MRIGIASDFHLGFGSGRRKGDSRKQAERAMKALIGEDVDLILLAGDIFDSPVPRPETFKDAAGVFRLARRANSDIRLTGLGRDTPEYEGIPVVAIHGNHERRVRGEVNPPELLDIMGFLVYIHNSGVMTDDISIYGIGSVPESYSVKVFQSLSSIPKKDTSFFVFHQDMDPYIPYAKLKFSHLPRGFSHYINGHIHASRLEKKFLICGSTVVTQMKREETEKCVWVWDGDFKKIPIKSRPLYYVDVDAAGRAPGEIIKEIDDELDTLTSKDHDSRPMIRIRVTGKLASGFKPADLLFVNDYDAIVSFRKRLEGGALSDIDMENINIDHIAVKALEDILKKRKMGINASKLYAHLIEGDETGVWNLLEEVV